MGVFTSVYFYQIPELGIRTKDEIDTGAGPLPNLTAALNGCAPRWDHRVCLSHGTWMLTPMGIVNSRNLGSLKPSISKIDDTGTL